MQSESFDNKHIYIIGLDLSFNSTGICFVRSVDNIAETVDFFRVVKSGVIHKNIKNVNHIYYDADVDINKYCIDTNDINNFEQIKYTVTAMNCARAISSVIKSKITSDTKIMVACIENYIMPSFGGKNNLRNVSGLINLQGYVRQFLLNYCDKNDIILYMLTPTPSTIKKNFCGNGSADKDAMVYSFINNYDGQKLLPGISIKDTNKINDIVDAFSLSWYAYGKILGINNKNDK